jgi:MspA
MKRNFSESATAVAHRADGMAASLSDRGVPLRRDVHGQPVYADWGGGRPEDAIEGISQNHLIAKTLDRCVGRSLRQQAKGRAVLLTSVGTGPEFDDRCAVVRELREDRQPRKRAFCFPEQGSQGAPAGAASGPRAGAFTNGLPVLGGAAAALFACMSIGFAGAAPVAADPGAAPAANGPTDPVADAGPPPPPVDDGHVASTPPVTTKFPNGWTLTVSAHDETERPVPSLTDEAGTREYIVGGVFNGSVHAPAGAGTPRGTFEVGYQTACQTDTQPPAHLTFGIGPDMASDLSLFGASVITTVPVAKKEFNGTDPWVMVSGFSIKIDGGVNGHTHLEDACVGQSFIRSYATLTASTDTSNVSQSYYGTIKAS